MLGVAQFPGGPQVDPAGISLRFAVEPVSVIVEFARGSAELHADQARKAMRRQNMRSGRSSYRGRIRYTFGPLCPAQVAGNPGVSRVVWVKKPGRLAPEPVLQMYAVTGQYALTMTVNGTEADQLSVLGPIKLYPAAPPVITPVVQLLAPGGPVAERLTINLKDVRATAEVTADPVPVGTDQFAADCITAMRAVSTTLAVGDWQRDVFLGGHPCLHTTLLRGGSAVGSLTSSEFWWGGVVGGRGIQLSVRGRKSIIGPAEARPLHDIVTVLPPG